MAAVEQRLGWVRRGATPAAPKPINLPSQKYENYRLVSDVEIVPRGTCCWGSAGRSIPASGNSNDQTDSASPSLGSNVTEDHGSKVPNDSVSIDEVQSPAEKSDEAHSSTSQASSTACTPSAEAYDAFSNLGVGVGNMSAKDGSDSAAASDADSFSENIARPSSSESYSSSSFSPTKRVEEQKHGGFSQVCSGDNERVSNAQAKKEIHVGQDFGYFEGFYDTQSSFSRPDAPYPNAPGMAFGPGMHPKPPHHYSFLGVPYYDSVKDKEIVVITMVGNPGAYGSYLPYPGFLNQFGRPSVYGNLPLQFGHFEHCIGPQVSTKRNPMCSGEEAGYMCYAQENYKQDWANGSPVGMGQRNNGVHFPTSLSTFGVNPRSDDCNMSKRMGRQKAVNRNRRPTREASPMPERRVTLLTKVSQHEVIISNVQRTSKHGGARRAKTTHSPHVFPEDVFEVAHDSMAIPVCASQPNGAISPVEASAGDMVQGQQSGAFHSTIDHTALESTETAIMGKVVKVESRCISNVSEKVSDHGSSSPQAACRASDEDSISEPRCEENAKAAVFEPFLALESIPLPMTTSTSTPIPDAQASNEWPAHRESPHQGSPPTCPKIEVPGSSVETFYVCVDDIRFESEVRCVSKVGEIWLDDPCNNLTECTAFVEPPFECTDDKESLSVSSAACLPNGPIEESPRKLLAQTGNRKWRRKSSVDATKLGGGGFSQKVQDSGVIKRASCPDQLSDLRRDGMHTSSGSGSGSLLSSSRKINHMSESGLSACYGASAALSSCDESTACSQAMVPSVSIQDQFCKDKTSKDLEAGFPTTGGSECAAEVLDSSMKTSSVADRQSLLSRSVSCGAGKIWRPKLSGAAGGHENFATKDSGVAPNVSGLQAKDNGLVSEVNHTLEVLSEEYCMKHSKVNMQDEGCNKLANTASLVAKVHCNYLGGERSTQQPRLSVESVEDVQTAGENKLSQSGQKQQRSEDLHLTHGNETILESSRSVEVELNSRKNSFPRNIHLGKQGNNTWRIAAKQVPQQKPSLASNLDPHNDYAAKSKELLAGKQGVSWKRKQLCTANKGSTNGVKDDSASNLALQNEICAEGKEQGNRRPFSMKNFLNDDNRKSPQLHSSAHMEHGMVRENMCAVGTGDGKSNSSSRTTYMKVGRCGESHFAKKVDRKGWVVKSDNNSKSLM